MFYVDVTEHQLGIEHKAHMEHSTRTVDSDSDQMQGIFILSIELGFRVQSVQVMCFKKQPLS